MRWSELNLKTFKETPKGASIASHILLLRAGLIYNTSQGIYLYNTLFLRSIQKFENIIRKNMQAQGAREIFMPMVQSKDIWEKSGRWDKFEGLLLKMKGRTGQELCLGPTHEELIIDFVQSNMTSYKDMPLNLFQIQTKYRDEIRPRFGLMRAREFIMKDAYSFDVDSKETKKNYQKMHQAYEAIFKTLKVQFVVVQADSGAIGGSQSQEFHILSKAGEDEILVSEDGAFAANSEICPRQISLTKSQKPSEQDPEVFATKDVTSIKQLADFLKCQNKNLVKTMILSYEDLVQKEKKYLMVLCAGDDEINLFKIKTHLNLKTPLNLANAQDVYKITGSPPGSCGPWNLKINIPVYLDHKLQQLASFITGANKEFYHVKNLRPNKDFKIQQYGDFCWAKEGDLHSTGSVLKKYRGIEVGHLFYLADTYSKAMNLSYLDKQGKKQFVQMGCYGLGVTRTLQALIEQSHDDKGIIWPICVAPYAIHINLLDPQAAASLNMLKTLQALFKLHNLDYFIDDRQARPGVKFKDADLLGCPISLTLGERDLKESKIDINIRKTGVKIKLSIKEFSQTIEDLIKNVY